MMLSLIMCSVHQILFKSRMMRYVGHVTRMRERRCAYRMLVGKRQGKRPLRRPRRRWDDNIKVDPKEIVRAAWNGSIWLRARTVTLPRPRYKIVSSV
jgi:hypothetical protein